VVNDVVTISTTTFVGEKRWTGSAWVDNGVVIDGKLIVPGSILASSIDTRNLTIRDSQGNVVISAGGLQPGFEAPGTKNSDVTLSTLGAPAAALSRVAIGTMHSGGNGNVRFVANQNYVGTANDGEIRTLGTTFYHPDGTKRTVLDQREVSTPFEDVTTADPFFIIYTDTSPLTRFGTAGYTSIPAAAISPNFFAAVYNLATGVWQAVDNQNVRTTFTPLATDCIVAIGRKYTSSAGGAGIDMLSSLLSVNTNLPADGATVGAPTGTFVAGVAASSVATATTNFNASNDRNSAAVVAPTIAADGTAVDHSARTDGAVDISFEWAWAGTEGDIDGFLVYVVSTTTTAAYAFGTAPEAEIVYTVPANKRSFILTGAAANLQTTFGVQAYRSVDKDINAAGVIKSTLVKPSLAAENPYRPSTNVGFYGDIYGTINGTSAATVATNAAAGKAASDALPDKVSKSAANIMTGAGALVSGSLTVDANGYRAGGYGCAQTQRGWVAYNSSGVLTFQLDAAGGNPYFAGQLAAAYGTLGSLKIAPGGAIMGGSYTGNASPPSGQGGFYIDATVIAIGNYNDGRYAFLKSNGDIEAPGLNLTNKQLTLTNTILISPQIAKIAGSFVSSPANSYYFTAGANNTNAFAGAYEMNLTSPDGTETFAFSASCDNAAIGVRIGGVVGKRCNLYVAGNGYFGEVTVSIAVSVNRGGISSTFGVQTTVSFQ
jgi:hypothetical protein